MKFYSILLLIGLCCFQYTLGLPEIISEYKTGSVSDIDTLKDTAYLATTSGLIKMDVSDPFNPIKQKSDENVYNCVKVNNENIITCDATEKKIKILNFEMEMISSISLQSIPHFVKTRNDLLFIGCLGDNSRIHVYNVSDISNPEYMYSRRDSFISWFTVFNDEISYIGNYQKGLTVVNTNDINQVYNIVDNFVGVKSIVIDNEDDMYLVTKDTLYIVRIVGNPKTPKYIGKYDEFTSTNIATDLSKFDLVVATKKGIDILDISFESKVVLVDSIDLGKAICLSVNGDFAFVGTSKGLTIIDIHYIQPIKPNPKPAPLVPHYGRSIDPLLYIGGLGILFASAFIVYKKSSSKNNSYNFDMEEMEQKYDPLDKQTDIFEDDFNTSF